MKSFKFLLFAVLFLVVGILIGLGFNISSQTKEAAVSQSERAGKVSLMLDFGDGNLKTYQDISLETNKTVFDILKLVVEKDELVFDYDPPGKWGEGMGAFIKQISDKKNGEDGKYWQYWVNNIHPPDKAADQYVLKNGDVIEWKFIKPLF